MKKRLLTVALAAVLALSLVACTGGSKSGNSSSEVEKKEDGTIVLRSCFAVGMTGAVNNFAIEKGLYKAEGIEFENTAAQSNDAVLSLISRGEIDVADGDPSTYIPGINNGVPAKLVGNIPHPRSREDEYLVQFATRIMADISRGNREEEKVEYFI